MFLIASGGEAQLYDVRRGLQSTADIRKLRIERFTIRRRSTSSATTTGQFGTDRLQEGASYTVKSPVDRHRNDAAADDDEDDADASSRRADTATSDNFVTIGLKTTTTAAAIENKRKKGTTRC